MLKEDRFKPLRDQAPERGRPTSIGRLEGLLKDQPDRGVRARRWAAYSELGEPDREDRRQAESALAAHRRRWRCVQGIVGDPIPPRRGPSRNSTWRGA